MAEGISEERPELRIPAEADKLRQLGEFLPYPNRYISEFGQFVAARLEGKQISPLVFVLTCMASILELERGLDGYGKQLPAKYRGYPNAAISLFQQSIPTIAEAVYPPEFAQKVRQEYEKAKRAIEQGRAQQDLG